MEQLTGIICTILNNRQRNLETSLSSNTILVDDLGFDSLDLAELTVRIEALYDVDIFENGLISTFGEICQLLKINE